MDGIKCMSSGCTSAHFGETPFTQSLYHCDKHLAKMHKPSDAAPITLTSFFNVVKRPVVSSCSTRALLPRNDETPTPAPGPAPGRAPAPAPAAPAPVPSSSSDEDDDAEVPAQRTHFELCIGARAEDAL